MMGMGIVSDEDFEKELDNSSSDRTPEVKIPEILDIETPGRKPGDNNVPDSLRKIIGETANIEGRQDALQIAERFGISPSSVSAYTNGSTSTKSMNKTPNKDHINKAKRAVSKRARIKLMKALDCITDDKLEGTKAVELASIAKSMSGIVKDMEPDNPESEGSKREGPSIVVYAPQVRSEQNYDVIIARE